MLSLRAEFFFLGSTVFWFCENAKRNVYKKGESKNLSPSSIDITGRTQKLHYLV